MTQSERDALQRLVTAVDDTLTAFAQNAPVIQRALTVAKRHGCPTELPDFWSSAKKAREALAAFDAVVKMEPGAEANAVLELRRWVAESHFTLFTQTQLLNKIDRLLGATSRDEEQEAVNE